MKTFIPGQVNAFAFVAEKEIHQKSNKVFDIQHRNGMQISPRLFQINLPYHSDPPYKAYPFDDSWPAIDREEGGVRTHSYTTEERLRGFNDGFHYRNSGITYVSQQEANGGWTLKIKPQWKGGPQEVTLTIDPQGTATLYLRSKVQSQYQDVLYKGYIVGGYIDTGYYDRIVQ